MLPRLPREIVRVERDAMTADARYGIKRHEAERLGRGGANHFPGVDVQRITKPRHFVRHADVDGAKSVLEQFGSLCYARGTDGVHVIHDLRIEKCGSFG